MPRTIIKYDLLVTIIAGLFDKTSIATCTEHSFDLHKYNLHNHKTNFINMYLCKPFILIVSHVCFRFCFVSGIN